MRDFLQLRYAVFNALRGILKHLYVTAAIN